MFSTEIKENIEYRQTKIRAELAKLAERANALVFAENFEDLEQYELEVKAMAREILRNTSEMLHFAAEN